MDVDVAALVRGSIDRGRRKHRRQTIGTTLAAAVSVAGLVGAVLTLAPLPTAGNSIGPAGASTPTAVSPKPSAPMATKPTTIPTPPATANFPVRAAQLIGLFKQLHPGRIQQAEERTGRIRDDGKQSQSASFLWNGFETGVSFDAYHGTPAQRCAERNDGAKTSTRCVERPDGSILMSGQHQAPPEDGSIKYNGAVLITADGYEISASSTSSAGKEEPNLAAEPPLTPKQLELVVTSKIWF